MEGLNHREGYRAKRNVTIWNGLTVSRWPSQAPCSIGRSSRSTSPAPVVSKLGVTLGRSPRTPRLVQTYDDVVSGTVLGELHRLHEHVAVDADQRLHGRPGRHPPGRLMAYPAAAASSTPAPGTTA